MDLYYNSSLPGPFQDRVSRHLRDVGGSSFCNVSWYLHYMFVSIGSSVPKPTTDRPLDKIRGSSGNFADFRLNTKLRHLKEGDLCMS